MGEIVCDLCRDPLVGAEAGMYIAMCDGDGACLGASHNVCLKQLMQDDWHKYSNYISCGRRALEASPYD